MGVVASISYESSAKAESIRLWHGTEAACAESIVMEGVNAARILETNGAAYRFWTTFSPKIGFGYAKFHQKVIQGNGIPVLLGFDIIGDALREMMYSDPVLAGQDPYDQAYWFEPEGFHLLNKSIGNFTITNASNLITFDEKKG